MKRDSGEPEWSALRKDCGRSAKRERDSAKPLEKTAPHHNLIALGELPASPACEIFGFRNQLNSFQDERVFFEKDPLRIRHAKAVVRDFVPDHPLQEIPAVLKILVSEYDSALRNVL